VIVAVPGPADEAVLREALAIGADHVAELPAAEPWLLDRLTEAADVGTDAGHVWGFVGASGGVGTSSLAAAVAVVMAGAGPTALLDLDPVGAGVEGVLGSEVEEGIRWSDLHAAPGRLTASALRDALPRTSGPAVLGFGSRPDAVDPGVAREVLTAARRGHDVVVVDLPRWGDDAATSVLATCDRVVVVCAAHVRGVRGARRILERLPSRDAVELVVRTTSRSADANDVAAALGVQQHVVLGEDRGLEERLDLGLGPCHRRRSPMTRAAEALARRLAGAS
jgi:secretion/DNA translocation related CpaE-like protein